MTGVTIQREDDLAWELVEQYRDLLTAEERTAIFLSLGVGDYPSAIRGVLNAVATQKKVLTERAAAGVQAWIDCYDSGLEFAVLLSRIGRATALDEETVRSEPRTVSGPSPTTIAAMPTT